MSWLRWATSTDIERATLVMTRRFLEQHGWEVYLTDRMCAHGVYGERWRKPKLAKRPPSVWVPTVLCEHCSWPGSLLMLAQRDVAVVERKFLLAVLEEMLPTSGPWNHGACIPNDAPK